MKRTEKINSATQFLLTFFNTTTRWHDMSTLLATENAPLDHPLLKDSTIKTAFDLLPSFRSAFPDMQQKIILVALSEDECTAFIETIASATFTAPFGKVAPTHKQCHLTVRWRISLNPQGKITAASELFDHFELTQQLGIELFSPTE